MPIEFSDTTPSMNPIELFSGRDRNFNTVTICDIIKLAEQLSSTTPQSARQVISIQTRTGEDRREAFVSESAIIERLISAAQLLAPVMRCIEDEAANLSTVPAMFVIKAISLIDLTDSPAPSALQTASTAAIPTLDIPQPSNLLEATPVSLNPMPSWTRQSSASHSNAEAPILDDVVYAHREYDYYEHIDTIPNSPVSASGSAVAGGFARGDEVYGRGQYVQQPGVMERSIPQKRKRAGTGNSTGSAPPERSTLCMICLDGDLDTCFSNCGHVCCAACATVMDRCPICRMRIKEKVKVYAVLSY